MVDTEPYQIFTLIKRIPKYEYEFRSEAVFELATHRLLAFKLYLTELHGELSMYVKKRIHKR